MRVRVDSKCIKKKISLLWERDVTIADHQDENINRWCSANRSLAVAMALYLAIHTRIIICRPLLRCMFLAVEHSPEYSFTLLPLYPPPYQKQPKTNRLTVADHEPICCIRLPFECSKRFWAQSRIWHRGRDLNLHI